MRKRLLTATMALLCAVTGFAFETGDYVLTKTQRFKITGENMVRNGDFSDAMNGWHGDALSAAPSNAAWDVAAGEGPDGEYVLKSLGNATEDAPFTGIVSGLEVDESYVFTAMVKATDKFTTGTDVAAANCFSVFLTTGEEHLTKADGDSIVAAAVECVAGEWTQVAFYFVNKMGGNDASITRDKLVIYLNKLPKDVMITNIGLYKAEEVYDIRILQKRIAYIRQLMAEPNFDTADAAEAKGSLQEVITGMEEAIKSNDLDDISGGEAAIASLNEAFETFLNASSASLDSQIASLDFTSVGTYKRGRYSSTGTNVALGGGSWMHTSGADFLWSGIQTGQVNTAQVTITNSNFIAGKYFFTAEIRGARSTNSKDPYNPAFDVIVPTTISVGNYNEVIDLVGEDYTSIAIFGDVTEDGKFEAKIDWPGPDNRTLTDGTVLGTKQGGCFYIRNVHVRYMGEDPSAKIAHQKAWDAFLPQYNAMVSARNKSVEILADSKLPWANDSIQRAITKFDEYYNKVIAKGWVTENGEDAGVATTEELEDFATSGWGLEDERPEGAFSTFTLIRAYQKANEYVIEQNAAITKLAEEIEAAEAILADPMYGTGDKTTFQAAIKTAQDFYDSTLASTTDETRETDEAGFESAKTTLITAEEAFKKSGELAPIVNIDFATVAEKVTPADETAEAYYAIKGAAGEMTIAESIFNDATAESSDNWNFEQGYAEELKDILHVGGSGYGYVAIPEEVTADDVIRIQCDVWYGNLGNGNLEIDLVDADNNRIAGFSRGTYSNAVNYNDFQNEAGTGMDAFKISGYGSSSVGNAGICADANRTSFDLIIDRKMQAVKGSFSRNGSVISEGEWVSLPALADASIAKFRIGSTSYAKANAGAHARRCWFDNLVIYKYASTAEGPMVAKVKGDVNGNNEVNALDIQEVINAIVAGNNDAKYDVNGDNVVNGLDIQEIINIIVAQ